MSHGDYPKWRRPVPYEIVENHPKCSADQVAVVKKSDRSALMGCHDSKESAKRQIAALNANED